MNVGLEVAVLRVGRAGEEIPLSDWAVSRLLECCLQFEANWPRTLWRDPSLARWIAARMPREASLGEIAACIDSIARQNPIDVFSATIVASPMAVRGWQAFQAWWRQEAAVARLVHQTLAGSGAEAVELVPVLCQLIGPALLPHALHVEQPRFELVTRCHAEVELVKTIERIHGRIRADSQLIQQALSTEEHARVDRALNPLHRLLPDLLLNLAELRELRQRFDERLEHEKLLSMRELAYGASHEINNPLANISSRAQVLLRDESDPERRRSLATINSQAFRAFEMIADMMLFAKPPALTLSPLDPKEFLDSLAQEFSLQLPPSIELRREDAETLPARLLADPIQLTVAIQAICTNAVEAMEGQGQLVIRLRPTPVDWNLNQAALEIEIQDDGPGIPPEVRKHLFDPFYSGREAGRGLGFGLSKAWRIIQLHGGQIFVDSQAGEGATFTLCLPVESNSEVDEDGLR